MPIEKNNNLVAVGIGIILIILIAGITFFRPKSPAETVSTDSPPQSAVKNEAVQTPSFLLSSADLLDKINTGKNISIIDVRSADEFSQEHILDSQNIPLDSFNPSQFSLDKQKIYVVVDSGDNSGLSLAQDTLPQNGISSVFYLDGGFQDWKNNGNPTITAGDPTLFGDQAKVSYIKSNQLKDIISTGESLAIIDLRSAENFQKGHIEGAINIFLNDLEKKRAQIPRGKKIILCDKDGLWAFQGSVRLFDMGFSNAFCLSDGLDGWSNNKYPLTAK
jgi:rhodanese-related sulfurtransferase